MVLAATPLNVKKLFWNGQLLSPQVANGTKELESTYNKFFSQRAKVRLVRFPNPLATGSWAAWLRQDLSSEKCKLKEIESLGNRFEFKSSD